MCSIICKTSKKTNKTYVALVVNGVYVSFDIATVEKVALTNGISNIDISRMRDGDVIDIIENK